LFATVSAVSYTGANIALKMLSTDDLRVETMSDLDWSIWVSAIKAVPVAIISWVLIAYRATCRLPALPPRNVLLPLLATGVVMQVGGNVMFQWALSLGGLALSITLCFGTLITGGAVLGRIVLGEPITRRMAAAIVVLISAIGLASISAQQASRSVSHDEATLLIVVGAIATACASGLAYASGGVMIRRTVTRDVSLSATLVVISCTGVVGLGFWSVANSGISVLGMTSAEALALMIVAGTFNAAAFYAVSKALQLIPVVRVNTLNSSQVVMGGLAGVMFFDESLTFWLVAGIGLTIVGLMLVQRQGRGGESPNSGDETAENG
jgi:drug/metabolite transporter (DMT)-like permease